MERPVCVLSGASAKSDVSRLYGNVEALVQLRDALTQVLDGGVKRVEFPVTKDRSWHMLEVHLSVEEDFRTGDSKDGTGCKCGCQDKFKEIEARYAQPWSGYEI